MENQHHHRHQQHSSSYEYDYPILDHGNNYQLIDHNKRIGTFVVQSKKMAINTIDDDDDDDDDDRQQHQQKPPYDLNKQQDDGVKLKQQLYEQTNDGSKFDVTNQMHVTSNHLQTPIDDNDQNIKIVHKLVQQKVHQKISDKLDQVQHTERKTNDHFGSRQILIDDSDHHSTNYINNNLKIVNQKRKRFSRDRTVSDDATLLVTQPTSTEPVFDSSNIINNSFDCDSNEKIIKTIECHSSSTTLNDSNLPKNYHVSLPSLNTSTLTKSVAFDPITTIKVDDDNVIYNLTSRFQLQSIFLRNHSHRSSNNYQTAKSTKQPLSILKSSKSTSIYFDGHRKTCPKSKLAHYEEHFLL